MTIDIQKLKRERANQFAHGWEPCDDPRWKVAENSYLAAATEWFEIGKAMGEAKAFRQTKGRLFDFVVAKAKNAEARLAELVGGTE